MFCKYCGSNLVDENNKFCPYCGKEINSDNNDNNSNSNDGFYDDNVNNSSNNNSNFNQNNGYNNNYYNYSQNNNQNIDDSGSAGWLILGLLIPLVGIILYFVFKSDGKLNNAKRSITGALIGICFNIFFYVLVFVGSCSTIMLV